MGFLFTEVEMIRHFSYLPGMLSERFLFLYNVKLSCPSFLDIDSSRCLFKPSYSRGTLLSVNTYPVAVI